MTKTLHKVGIKGTYLNIIKAMCDTPSEHYPQWLKIESISSKLRKKDKWHTLTPIMQHIFGNPSHSIQRRKLNKRNPVWKEAVKLSLFADNMIFYTENPKDATKTFTRASQWI